MKNTETSKKFVELTANEGYKTIYIRPEDIVALCWDAIEGVTKITTVHGEDCYQDTVEETPGVIFDKCDKAARCHDE